MVNMLNHYYYQLPRESVDTLKKIGKKVLGGKRRRASRRRQAINY